jgi:hypothetical protein
MLEKKAANILFEDKFIKQIKYDSFTSEAIEKAYFFMLDGKNIAIIPHTYLIIFL